MENQTVNSLSAKSVPLLLALAGLIILVTGQLVASYHDRQALLDAQTSQNTAYQQSTNLRTQLTGLAGQVALLAQSGDIEAQAIVTNFAKQGIKFSPPAAAAPASK